MKACYACGEPWNEKRTPGFRETCLRCGALLHVCKNCRFYDENANPWCREPQARSTRPRSPEESQTCEYFLFADATDRKEQSEREAKAKAGLAALFGETPSPTPSPLPDWMKKS